MSGSSAASASARAMMRMRSTILHAFVLLVVCALPAAAQPQHGSTRDPFSRGAWHFDSEAVAALEAWNYNVSHEEIYGLTEGITYGLRDGLALRASQRFMYVSQRSQDAVILGLTIGVRGRVYQRGRASLFLQGDVGISYTAVATPPRGTRFNYLAIGGGGVMVRVTPGLHVHSTLQLIHLSNASVAGRGRNPDIEAIGPTIGLTLRIR
jgi:hypothetical protein